MKTVLLLLCAVAVTLGRQCGQGQEEGQYDTNMKVNVQLSSLEKVLNRGSQSFLEKGVKAALVAYPLESFSADNATFSRASLSKADSLEQVTVSRNQALFQEELVLVTVPALQLTMDIKQDGTKAQFKTKAQLEVSFKAVSSMAASWRAQLFFRQLKVKFQESQLDKKTVQDSQLVSKMQAAVGRAFGKQLSAQQKELNAKLAQLEQHYFMGDYDLGLAYNYTLQPGFSSDGEEYSFNLHGMLHHSYHYVLGDPIRHHRIASQANEASFLSIPANNQNVTMRYLLSDRLLSSMFGAQYETPTALDQTMAPIVIDKFLKWLEVGVDLNTEVVDKLFDGVTNVTLSAAEKKAVLAEKVGVSLKAADYPYFNLTSDNTVNVVGPVRVTFLSRAKEVLAEVLADMKMSFQLKHDLSRPTVLNLHNLGLRVEAIKEFSNKVQPQTFSREDLQNVQRVLNGALYIWAKGIQKTMNLNGLEISQFLPSLSVEQLSGSNRNVRVEKTALLQLVKGHQQMKKHNAFVNTHVDLSKIKSTVSEIVSAVGKYMFSE